MFFAQRRKLMKHARKTVLAASAFTCAALLSFAWSEQGGISLSIESAQARVGRPLTPVSVAGVARRHNRRAAYGAGVVGAGAAAVGTAAAIGAAARSRPPHLTGDGEATPTKQAPVTTQVVLTTVGMFGAPGRLTTAVHPRHGAVRAAATLPSISKIYTTQGITQRTISTPTGPSRRISVRSRCSIDVRLPVSI